MLVEIGESTKVQVEEVEAYIAVGALGRWFLARKMSYEQ